ncbi:eukaryotic type KH-domain (KH-domain type I) [Lepidopterella palustris CBS 459.81]|uniref:Pre-rRNA-processing protein PNO1 n=1 Tax=Lepidopterella palustris CBS 459.81 TaxID=1314670 RepID=A0A8E2EHW6_9PEZI|nr:eukaryotic type KH-domain (KH-domain type I) [Lepidopterella palustris CBS 459.81]
MPAPTALLRKPDALAEDQAMSETQPHEEKAPLLDMTAISAPTSTPSEPPQDVEMTTDETGRPQFPPAKDIPVSLRREMRKVPIPPHRMAPLKSSWQRIYTPLVENLKLQVRMNVAKKCVELRTSKHTTETGSLQKGEDFLKAFMLGFDCDDCISLLRLDEIYVETFEIKDVKTLTGDHLSRAIGRIAGKDGKTKFAIENAAKVRITLADSKIHILGQFKNIHVAREAIVSLILGSPPGKVYGNLRTVASRMKERF